MTTELKPCPFCGSEAKPITNPLANEVLFVRCSKCACENVLRLWNARPQPIVTTDGLVERLLSYAPADAPTIAFGEQTTRQMNRDLREAADAIETLELRNLAREAECEAMFNRIQSLTDRIASLERALEAGGTRILVLLGAERDAMPKHIVKAFQEIANDMTDALSTTNRLDDE